MNITEDVLKFFDSRGGVPGTDVNEKRKCFYLDEKIIDSMGIIEMVTHFETIFEIRFSAEDLQSQEFQTIGGLIDRIGQLRDGRQ